MISNKYFTFENHCEPLFEIFHLKCRHKTSVSFLENRNTKLAKSNNKSLLRTNNQISIQAFRQYDEFDARSTPDLERGKSVGRFQIKRF